MKENLSNILFMVLGIIVGAKVHVIEHTLIGPVTTSLTCLSVLTLLVYNLMGWSTWLEMAGIGIKVVVGIIGLGIWIGLGLLNYVMDLGTIANLVVMPIASVALILGWIAASTAVTHYIKTHTNN